MRFFNMQLLPVVSWETKMSVERSCIMPEEGERFVKEVWGSVIQDNRRLATYWYHLFSINGKPIWGGTAMVAICQLYRALEIEMRCMPVVDGMTFAVVDATLTSTRGKGFWQKRQHDFHTGNPELSKLVISTSKEGVQGVTKQYSRNVIDTAFTFYLLLEEQMRLERSPILIVVPKSAG